MLLLLCVAAASLAPGFAQPKLRALHQSLGLLLWILGALLLAWRGFGRAPRPEPTRFSWQIAASRVVTVSLHALLVVLPLLGYIAASIRGDRIQLLGTLSVPGLPVPARSEWMLWLAAGHRILAWCFLACLFVHVGVALYHHFVVRDRMLERMLPRWSRR